MRPWRLGILALSPLFACRDDADAKREATTLVAAIDNFRAADNAYKPAAAKAVGAVACTDKNVCEAKQACFAAIDATARGIALDREVEQGLTDVEAHRLAADDPSVRALPEKAKQARALLDQGHAAMPACDEKIVALKVRFHVGA